MPNLFKKIIAVGVFAFTGQAFAMDLPPVTVSQGQIQRLQEDSCPTSQHVSGFGEVFSCKRDYRCTDGSSIVIRYDLSFPNFPRTDVQKTIVSGACSAENSQSEKACLAEPESAPVNSCWNQAIIKRVLRNVDPLAENGPAISCSQTNGAKGLYITMNPEDDDFKYTFGTMEPRNERTIRTDSIRMIFKESGPEGCKLSVYSLQKKEERFILTIPPGSTTGSVKPAKSEGEPPPAMSCRLKPEIVRQFCTQKADSTPIKILNDSTTGA